LSSYYYFAATLPMLQKQSEMPFSMEEFLTLCRYHMNRRDSAVVEAAVTGGEAETSLTVLRRLREYRKAVSEELASLRARRLGRDQAAYADRSLWVADAEAAAKAAYGASDPLETVEMLFMQEWRLLDELESQHYFDLEKIVIYALKLQLLHRASCRSREQGREEFGHIFSNVQATDGHLS
jgi:hypothetical protein